MWNGHFLVLVLLLLPACALSDLRPAGLRGVELTVEREQRGRALLDKALDVTGGRAAWERIASAELRLADEWGGIVGYLFRPWPSNPTELRMHYDFPMLAGRGEFLSGSRRGETWGREGNRTWRQKSGGDRTYRKMESVRFILAAYQYFFELPLRLTEAPIVQFAGERERDGRRYELVFVTWAQAEPHKEHDQYLLWMAADSGRIEIAQYTIRDKFRFATGVNFFSDFRPVGGLILPHAYWIARNLDDEDFVHRVQLEDIRLQPGVARDADLSFHRRE